MSCSLYGIQSCTHVNIVTKISAVRRKYRLYVCFIVLSPRAHLAFVFDFLSAKVTTLTMDAMTFVQV